MPWSWCWVTLRMFDRHALSHAAASTVYHGLCVGLHRCLVRLLEIQDQGLFYSTQHQPNISGASTLHTIIYKMLHLGAMHVGHLHCIRPVETNIPDTRHPLLSPRCSAKLRVRQCGGVTAEAGLPWAFQSVRAHSSTHQTSSAVQLMP